MRAIKQIKHPLKKVLMDSWRNVLRTNFACDTSLSHTFVN